jgi:hypothetical protein
VRWAGALLVALAGGALGVVCTSSTATATRVELDARAACGSERPRAIRNGARARRPEWVVGHGPVLLGGFFGPTATPALHSREGRKVVAKFYVMYSRRGPARVTITGWLRSQPDERLLLGDLATRRSVRSLEIRLGRLGPGKPFWRYLYQPSGLTAARPGCYRVMVRWAGGARTITVDLTDEALRQPQPRRLPTAP